MGLPIANTGDRSSLSGAPAQNAAAVTPNDTTVVLFRSLWVGGVGDVSVVMLGDLLAAPVTFTAVPAGTLLPIAVKRVRSTATTATLIVGLS